MSRWNSFRSLPKAPRHLCVCGLLLLACSQPVAPERPAMPSLEALIAHAKGQATPVKSTGEPVRPKNWQEEGYCAGQTLVLDDLTGLHGVEAGALSTYEGRCLHLNGLKRLDADIATLLSGFGAHHKGSEWGGAVLSLNGITTLDPTTAAALAKQTADVLLFNGLTELDVATATALAAFQGCLLYTS